MTGRNRAAQLAIVKQMSRHLSLSFSHDVRDSWNSSQQWEKDPKRILGSLPTMQMFSGLVLCREGNRSFGGRAEAEGRRQERKISNAKI